MNIKKSYSGLTIYGDKIVANQSVAGEKLVELTPGIYKPYFDHVQQVFWFEVFNPVSDDLLELDSEVYKQVTSEMTHFLKPETKESFNNYGFIYKRSALLHGLPGTGKTCIVNRIAKEVVKNSGVVLYSTNPDLIKMSFTVLDSIQPETTVMVVFEEFDEIANRYERTLLSLLDGEVQKHNVMYMATTNYLEKIPKRLYRPGRFSSVIEVDFPTANARRQYFTYKLTSSFKDLELYVAETHGFSIDELKEVIQSVIILNNDLQKTLTRIRDTRGFEVKIQEEKEKQDPFLNSGLLREIRKSMGYEDPDGYASVGEEN